MRFAKLVGLALVFAALPILGRWLWFYPGFYSPPAIPSVEELDLEVPRQVYQPSVDQPIAGGGSVVIDLAHENNLEIDDLAPLRDRLAARGVSVVPFSGSGLSLEDQLRGATALVVMAPTTDFTTAEREVILDFVEDGGLLLLSADPTRPVEEEPQDLEDILFPESAIPAVNSLANLFGVVYFDDYLYNLVENEGNYRNVRFTEINGEHALTQGLERVVFFAAHSLRTSGLLLLVGDANTLSPLRVGESGLAAAALVEEGRVLTLGDITFLTPPYNTVADNDHFLSNIADWLATPQREWDIRDFPYLFQRPVDLVQIPEGFLDPRLIARTGPLEDAFDRAGLTLHLRATGEADHDLLLVGTFPAAGEVAEHLARVGVSIALDQLPAEETAPDSEEKGEAPLQIEGLGGLPVAGIILFVVDRTPEKVVLVTLAEDGDAAVAALERLATLDFAGCIHHHSVVTVCSEGEAAEGLGLEAPPEGTPTEEVQAEGPPRVASHAEAEVAWEAGTPLLEDLAPEEYEVTSQAGERYVYTIRMDRSQDVMWVYGWCTTTRELLAENWGEIRLAFTLDGGRVSQENFVRWEGPLGQMQCRLYYALLTDWPPGQHLLTTEVTFTAPLNDGLDDYPAGTHIFEYRVSVAG